MYRHFFKRLIDVAASLIVLPFVLLVIIIMAPIIYMSDPGPVFYNAMRLGKDGRIFKMYKFRSMYVNAPDIRNEDGSTFNSEDDPRVTPIGRFLRKSSLDEVPQFLNVLFGSMSLVGPRPDLPEQYSLYTEFEKQKLQVLPGITGLNQAYFRNSIEWKDRLKNDVQYVHTLSFWLDVKIVYHTVFSVIGRKNIYHNETLQSESTHENDSVLEMKK